MKAAPLLLTADDDAGPRVTSRAWFEVGGSRTRSGVPLRARGAEVA